MAVDTRQKRFSMMNHSWVPMVVLFEADGAVDADDRGHLLNLYSGIAWNNPTPSTQAHDIYYKMLMQGDIV